MEKTDELRTRAIDKLITPSALAGEFPATEAINKNVTTSRTRIERILTGDDPRLLVIVGPCSVHDPIAALDYAQRLSELLPKYSSRLEIVMRTYFEKPRTVVGWKGLISDPRLDNSCQVNEGIRLARKLLIDVNALNVPTATEFLDMVTGQYIADLISWGAIGAGPRKARSTAKWPPHSPARSASKTVLTAISKLRLMPSAPHRPVICSCHRIKTGR